MQMPNNRCAWIKRHFHKYTCHSVCVLETAINWNTFNCINTHAADEVKTQTSQQSC